MTAGAAQPLYGAGAGPEPLGVAEAARLLAVSTRRVQQMCRTGELAARRDGAGRWLIDADGHPAFRLARGLAALVVVGDDRPAAADLAGLSDRKRSGLAARVAVVEAYLADVALRPPGRTVRDFQPDWCRLWNARHPGAGLTVRTLQRWVRAYRREGAAAMVDGRAYHGRAVRDERAWGVFLQLWLDERRPHVPRLHEIVAAEAARRGWAWPSVRTVQRWVAEELDPKVAALGREPRRFKDRHRPWVKRDWSRIDAMQLWVADHRQLDLFVPRLVLRTSPCSLKRAGRPARFSERGFSEQGTTADWRWQRPWLTMFMDARSWRPVAWSLAFDSPNGNRVMMTFAAGVRDHGLPDVLLLDNGKDFRMGRFSGGRWTPARKGETVVTGRHLADVDSMLGALGVEVSWALPYEARTKTVEPWFRLCAEWFDKAQPTYCGRAPDRRPADLLRRLKGRAGEHAAATLDADDYRAAVYGDGGQAVRDRLCLSGLQRTFDRWLTRDYGRRESPSNWCGGLSVERAFRELRAPNFVARRPAAEDLALLGMPSKPCVVGPNGIFVRDHGREYWADALAELAGASGRDRRRKVTYRWDPADPTCIWVFDRAGRFLCAAAPTPGRQGVHPLARLAGDADDQAGLAEALAHQKRRARAAREAKRLLTAPAADVRIEWAGRSAADLGRLDTAPMPDAAPAAIPLVGEVSRAAQAGRDARESARRTAAARQSAAAFFARTGTDDDTTQRHGAVPSALDYLTDGSSVGQGGPEETNHAPAPDAPA